MFNLNNLLNNPKYSGAINKAKQMGSKVNSKQQAVNLLSNLGVGNNTLRKVRNFMDNPLAPAVAKVFGANLNSFKEGLDSIINVNSNVNSNRVNFNRSSEIDDLRNARRNLK